MKRLLLFLVVFSVPVFSQVKNATVTPSTSANTWNYFYTIDDTGTGVPYADSLVSNRTMSQNLLDTVQIILTPWVKTFLVNVMVSETSTVLIDYALSGNGTNFTAFTVKDSIQHQSGGYQVKSVDFTSTILGHPYVKFRFRGSALAFAFGTSNPKYWASYTLKQR